MKRIENKINTFIYPQKSRNDNVQRTLNDISIIFFHSFIPAISISLMLKMEPEKPTTYIITTTK